MDSNVIFIYRNEYLCPKCEEGKLEKEECISDTTPAQYKYVCPICGYSEYRYE